MVFTRLFSGIRVTDTHNGFRALSRAAAERIKITQNRMAHASEILDQIQTLGLRFVEVAVTIHFLDKDNKTVGETSARTNVLAAGQMLPLEAALPPSAVRMQMYSLQWRKAEDLTSGRLFGPYRPWEFGYLQYDPNR